VACVASHAAAAAEAEAALSCLLAGTALDCLACCCLHCQWLVLPEL